MNLALAKALPLPLQNKSGGSLVQGDVVIVSDGYESAVETTTTVGLVNGEIGVVLEPNGIANDVVGMVDFGGYVSKVNLSASANFGDFIKTSATGKLADPHAAPSVAGDFGIVLGTGTSPAALLFGSPRDGTGTVLYYDFLSTLTGAEITVSATGALTISRMHVCNGSNIDVELPDVSGNTGKFIGARFDDLTRIVTAGAALIDGQDTMQFYIGQAAMFYCDGTNWFTVFQKIAPQFIKLFVEDFKCSKIKAYVLDASQIYGNYVHQISPANGDTLYQNKIWLNKGSYLCRIKGIIRTANGRITWSLDGVTQVTNQDWYNTSDAHNIEKTFTLTCLYTGYHNLLGTITGTSGAGYEFALNTIWIGEA